MTKKTNHTNLLKTFSLILLTLLLSIRIELFAQTYDMSNTNLVSCTGTYRDPGGASNYLNNQDFTQTISPSSAGNYIVLTFSSFDIESNTGCTWDYLEIYDGPSTAFPLLGRFCGTTIPGPFNATSSGGELTLKFHSDGSSVRAGWLSTISCTTTPPPPPPSTILLDDNVLENSCNAKFYDMGGSGSNYSSNQDFTKTIVPDNGGKLQITFNSFNIESNSGCTWDYLEIYDGPSTASPLLGRFCGTTLPGPFTSTAANGELTFKFHSDGSGVRAGWDADISCTAGTPMTYNQTLITQPNLTSCYQGFTNQEIVLINIQTNGAASPFDATQFRVRTDGCSSWSTDLTGSIKIYYTGSSSTFSTSNLFGTGTLAAPGNNILINGTQTLSGGDNYFWMAYDISSSATIGNVVDGLCNQVTVDNITRTTSPTTSPAGNRPIDLTPPSYTRYIGSASASANWARSIIYDSSDNTHVMAISGSFNGQTAGSYDNLIVKVDQAGDTIWTVSYGTANNDTPYDIIKTIDGGFIVVGQSNFKQASVIKISSIGNLEWRTFIDEGDANSAAQAVVESSSGNFIVAGWANSSNDMYLWELDKTTGALQNSARGKEFWFTVGGNTSQCYDIINTSDGGYALAGEIDNKPAVVKISSAYTVQWFMQWGSNGDRVKEIIENSANDYTVFIEENTGLNTDFHVMRFTNSANNPVIVWENKYDGTGDESIECAITTTGGYYIAGLGDIIGDPTNNEGWIMKISNNGTYVWDNYVGVDDVESYAIATATTGAVVAGLSNVVGSQAFYAKVDQGSYSCSATPTKPNVITTPVVGTPITKSFTNNGVNNGFGTIVSSPSLTKAQGFPNSEACNTVLPISLSSFTLDCNESYVRCAWTTLSEINNNYFTIEKSRDGLTFNEIALIEGAGNNNTSITYDFIDDRPLEGVSYYRLKQTDYNGNFNYVSLASSDCSNKELINVYPTLFNNSVTISFEEKIPANIKIKVNDNLGRNIDFNSEIITNSISLTFSNTLSKGIYFLSIMDNNKLLTTEKVIKINEH